jgi:hypothetical protein
MSKDLSFPWSKRQFTLLPQRPLQNSQSQSSENFISPSPFPRYGHSLLATGNRNGEIFMFGGLVGSNLSNELFCFSSRDQTFSLWQTYTDIPPPVVGHASAIVSNVLIVWGGETDGQLKTTDRKKLDNGLYLLNLGPIFSS